MLNDPAMQFKELRTVYKGNYPLLGQRMIKSIKSDQNH